MSVNFEPSIPEFYSGKNIFITGATGFLGKVLIEKFLRSCPDIGDIYVLIRPKRGKSIQERIRDLANNPLYDRVKEEQPNLIIEKRVIPLAGDCKELNLGLSPDDRNLLIEKIHAIFHTAASVRFDEPITNAILLNTRGTREICQLALDAKHILVFIHVSTTYVNCDRKESKEIIYPPKLDWKKAIEIAENMNNEVLDILTEKIIGDMPNTYTFSKHVAEHVVEDMLAGKVPCKIYRPSVVIASMREPVTGWVDNLNGPVGIVVACGLGILRTVYFDSRIPQDYIPVDVVIKSIIVCAWDLAIRSSFSKVVLPIEVMHGSACNVEWLRINATQWATYCISANYIVPLSDIIWIPNGHHTRFWLSWYIRTIFTMVLPSILIDALLKLKGKRPRLLKIQRKMYIAQTVLARITFKEYMFRNDNLLALQQRIQEKDKDTFDYEFKTFDLGKNMIHGILGARRYLLKTPDSTIESAKRHFNKIWWIEKSLHTVFWIMFIYLCIYVLLHSYTHFQKTYTSVQL